MRRANGFAMTELLVAIGIGALILTALIWLQVDFIGWTRRAMTLGQPSPSDRSLVAQSRAMDRCPRPGSVLAAEDGMLQTRIDKDLSPLFGIPEGTSPEVRTAARPDGSPRPGWSMAGIRRGDATIAVVALRCDLPEVCRYDPDKGSCGG